MGKMLRSDNILSLISELSKKVARYGDGQPVYHLNEAVIPVSEVLRLYAQVSDMASNNPEASAELSNPPKEHL